MERYKYILVGGGMTADVAVDGIREIDPQGEILLLSAEDVPPYNRPMLSKGLWKGKSIETIWRNTSQKAVEIKINTTVIKINPELQTIYTSTGETLAYEKLLIGTGGSPRKLPFDEEGVIYYRNLSDFKMVHSLYLEKKRFAVIGGGFIGSEIAAALAMNNREVLLFDVGAGIGGNIFPKNVVQYLNHYYQENGVTVIPNVKVSNVIRQTQGYQIMLNNNEQFNVDAVVAGIGIKPNVQLAEEAGLQISDGVDVNRYLQTTHKTIFASGDVANFYNSLLDQKIRVEHADNAIVMGRQAGRNMAGAEQPYDYLPFFYSDLFEIGYEAVGQLNSRSQVVEDWQEEFVKGVLYYLANDRVRGVLLWNVWDKVEEAREVIGLAAPVGAKELKGRIK